MILYYFGFNFYCCFDSFSTVNSSHQTPLLSHPPTQMIIKRRPLFYVVNLLVPSLILMIVDLAGFLLPPECGERVSFKVTILLGYFVFLTTVVGILPATAQGTPLIGTSYNLTQTCLYTRVYLAA